MNIHEYNHDQGQQSEEETGFRCPTLRHRPANLHCDSRTRTTLVTCTVFEETFSNCAEPTPTPPTTPQDCQVCVGNSVAPEMPLRQPKKLRTKWNCCLAVPDSPDSPNEPRCLMNICKHKMKNKGIPAIEGRPHRTHGHWSSAKLRVLFRVLSNLGQNRRRSQSPHVARNNQVVPVSNESSNTPETVQTVNNLVPVAYPEVSRRANALPALPNPPRRRLVSEMELANALTLLQQQQRCGRRPLSQYRRRRRSVVHRPKTPALSPIRESGLSNPASPSHQNCTVAAISGSCTRPF
nr:PREDICTED: uncharacterized protein LOC107397563 [Tribolium castaneum]|eukprot:XP_015833662.1 PREDICTED: uncharacterized protein LOC107397563 [Tribolium castaneum]